jgi:H+/Cl- antiporter ClcA
MADAGAAYLRTLVLAALIGVAVAVAAVLFQTAIQDLIHLIWEEIPDWFGWDEPAAWYVLLVPALAGVLVAAAMRLPGQGGHAPLQGLAVDPVPPANLLSILSAALATLGLGLVLGPEAPLIALGLGLPVLILRVVGTHGADERLLVLAGAFAAIAALSAARSSRRSWFSRCWP